MLPLLIGACTPLSTKPSAPQADASLNQKHLASLAHINAFSLKGRIGVVTNPRGFSGGIEWQHAISNDNIDIFSPIGGKVANIVKNASGVTLTAQDGNNIKAQDAESLTHTTLGWRLPLNGLSDWVLGKPTNGKIEASAWDESGRLTNLKQDGWDISYENYAEYHGVFLPNKVLLKSDKVNLKLVADQWISTEHQQ
jgi:outer membrane lipoprotein LolB